MASFWDDLSEFGSGLLDDVGEGFDSLVDSFSSDDTSTNAGTTQQPEQPVKDNHGNAVTGSSRQPTDNTLLYVGGGLAAAVVLIGLIAVLKK